MRPLEALGLDGQQSTGTNRDVVDIPAPGTLCHPIVSQPRSVISSEQGADLDLGLVAARARCPSVESLKRRGQTR